MILSLTIVVAIKMLYLDSIPTLITNNLLSLMDSKMFLLSRDTLSVQLVIL